MKWFEHPEVKRLHEAVPTRGPNPWASDDRSAVDAHLRTAVGLVAAQLGLQHRTEFDSYGSGYASFVDAWFHRPTPEFQTGPGNSYAGLVVLLCSESPHFVLGEGEKSWHDRGSSSYLPDFDFIDQFTVPAVEALVPAVERILVDFGMIRLSKNDLAAALPADIEIPTILSDPPFRLFDAMFYWED